MPDHTENCVKWKLGIISQTNMTAAVMILPPWDRRPCFALPGIESIQNFEVTYPRACYWLWNWKQFSLVGKPRF